MPYGVEGGMVTPQTLRWLQIMAREARFRFLHGSSTYRGIIKKWKSRYNMWWKSSLEAKADNYGIGKTENKTGFPLCGVETRTRLWLLLFCSTASPAEGRARMCAFLVHTKFVYLSARGRASTRALPSSRAGQAGDSCGWDTNCIPIRWHLALVLRCT